MTSKLHKSIEDHPVVFDRPQLGFGLGLRSDHYQTIIDTHPSIDWFEIISENYMIPGGKPLWFLEQIRRDYPMVMHGVSMSIGSCDPLDYDYLHELKALIARVEPAWVSDHLCWTGVHGRNLHDLMPLPYTQETVEHVAARIREVQDFLGRRMLIENVSSYVNFVQSEMTEWEFISALAESADCLLLLDVNNIYVSSVNHDFDPVTFVKHIAPERVQQVHLAGHTHNGNHIVATHDHPISDPVWELYRVAMQHLGPVSVMIERDDNIPPLDELLIELQHARTLCE